MANSFQGIVHTSPDGTLASLSLQEIRFDVFVVDVSARVTLRQVFYNPSDNTTGRAKYVFPVPARSAVCAFELKFLDGRVITGVCKEKNTATEEYTNALREGRNAGLVEWVTDDVFTISLGSIPAREAVTTKLTYVMDLMDDELRDQVRLQLPTSVGDRYGVVPAALADASSANQETCLRITVDVQMSGMIHEIESPTHEITVVPYVTRAGKSSKRRQTAKFRSKSFLAHDFVLTIHADGLDAPRCFAEFDPARGETVAMQLTLIPKVKFPPVPAQEYIFVVDRSGSMSGSRIETAKRTLTILLRMLPNAGTIFNIVSFGSHADGLWPEGEPFAARSLEAATLHIAGMNANYGGTELRSALSFALSQRNLALPSVMFVLTDGGVQAHEVDPIVSVVQNAVTNASRRAPLRVFTLGIGGTVSTAVVEGIARAGNGECLLASTSESIIGKCAKLFRAGRSSYVESISIDWGVENLPSSPAIQQSPPQIVKLYSGLRFVIFAIIKCKEIPQEVILRGVLNGGNDQFELIVPVSAVRPLAHKTPQLPLIHILAARHLITDIIEGTTPPPMLASVMGDAQKAAVVHLGETYQLASRHTSFVAVQNNHDSSRQHPKSRRITSSGNRSKQQANRPGPAPTQSPPGGFGSGFAGNALQFVANVIGGLGGIFGYNQGTGEPRRGRSSAKRLPGDYPNSSSSRSSRRSAPNYDKQEYDSTDTFSSLSSLEGSYDSDWTPPQSRERGPPPETAEDLQRKRAPSPSINHRERDPELEPETSTNHEIPGAVPPPVSTNVVDIISVQSFDGSFSPSSEFLQIVGPVAAQVPEDIDIDDTIWATAVAVAFLQKNLAQSGQSDLLDGLLEKIMEFVEGNGLESEDFDEIVQRARDLLV